MAQPGALDLASGSPTFRLMSDSLETRSRDALLVVDVVNDFDHEDGDRLFLSFEKRLTTMRKVIVKARTESVPVVYVNDEHDRWDSDAPALVNAALQTPRGAKIIEHLAPDSGDHFLLKHRYSAFDHTPLDLLLEKLKVERLLLIGAATEGCIVQTAIDAREHGLKTTIIADACASTDPALEALALDYAERVVGARIIRAASPRAAVA